MPYIEVVTNVKLEKNNCDELNRTLGKLIEIIPGKTEKWLMVHLEDEAKLCFAGDSESPAAIAFLKAFGRELSPEIYDELTAAVTEKCAGLIGVAPERFYVEYEYTSHWGWNGKNFQLK